jgi:hypothetical protein
MLHPKIRDKLKEIWEHADSDGNGTLDREEYFHMHRLMWLAVQGKLGERHMQKQRKSAQIDWELDKVKGKDYLDRDHFMKSWFLLADSFTESVSVKEYYDFLHTTHENMKKYESLDQEAKQIRERKSQHRKTENAGLSRKRSKSRSDMAHAKAKARALALIQEKLRKEKEEKEKAAATVLQRWWRKLKRYRERKAATMIQVVVRKRINRRRKEIEKRKQNERLQYEEGHKRFLKRKDNDLLHREKTGWELPQRIIEHKKYCLDGAACCICWNAMPESSGSYARHSSKRNQLCIKVPSYPQPTTEPKKSIMAITKSLSTPTLTSAAAASEVLKFSISPMSADRKGDSLLRSPAESVGRSLQLVQGENAIDNRKLVAMSSTKIEQLHQGGTSRLMLRLRNMNKTVSSTMFPQSSPSALHHSKSFSHNRGHSAKFQSANY